MNMQIVVLNDADLEMVSGGTRIGEVAQQVSGLFKAASDIGQAGGKAATQPLDDLIRTVGNRPK
jgi:hypothetical protein